MSTRSCTTPGCSRRQSRLSDDGLCATCHNALVHDRESPRALTGGHWAPGRHGIRQWVPGKDET